VIAPGLHLTEAVGTLQGAPSVILVIEQQRRGGRPVRSYADGFAGGRRLPPVELERPARLGPTAVLRRRLFDGARAG
jgi:hypothetical protein